MENKVEVEVEVGNHYFINNEVFLCYCRLPGEDVAQFCGVGSSYPGWFGIKQVPASRSQIKDAIVRRKKDIEEDRRAEVTPGNITSALTLIHSSERTAPIMAKVHGISDDSVRFIEAVIVNEEEPNAAVEVLSRNSLSGLDRDAARFIVNMWFEMPVKIRTIPTSVFMKAFIREAVAVYNREHGGRAGE